MPTEAAFVPSPAIVDRPGQRRGFMGAACPVSAPAMQGAPVLPLTNPPAGPGAAR
jgi:hypothetical protein